MERDHIESVLERRQGNRQQAARILGLNPITLWRKLKAWDRADSPDESGPPIPDS